MDFSDAAMRELTPSEVRRLPLRRLDATEARGHPAGRSQYARAYPPHMAQAPDGRVYDLTQQEDEA